MRIVTQSTFGPSSVLEVVEVEDPRPAGGEVLVDVAAAGVNPVDIAVRSGNFPLLGDPPFTLGWDVAGTVAEIGNGVTTLAVGDDVLGLVSFPQPGNAYADRVVASADELVIRPPSLTTTMSAALPLVGLTAWQALVGIARLEGGQRVLIHRAAGGVGHVAVQVAKSRGADVIGTASTGKHDLLRRLGADELIDYSSADYAKSAGSVDVVFDLLGGEHGARSAGLLVPGGLLISALGGNPGFSAEQATELGIRFEIVSVRPSAADLGALLALIDSGGLEVLVDETVPLADVAKAHELVEDGHVTGKVVLVP